MENDLSSSWHSEENSTFADDETGYTLVRNVCVIVVYGTITLVTIIGNLLVMLAFRRDLFISRKIANWYILNLSAADFTVGLVSMSINLAWLLTDDWPLGEITCKMYLVIDYVVTNVPVCTIIFISLDRYWLLIKKLDYPKYQTKTRALSFIAICWTFCIVFFTFITFAWIPITGFPEQIEYDWNCELEATYNFEFQIFMTVLFFLFPLLTIGCLNLIVYRNIRQRSKGFVRVHPAPAELPVQNEHVAMDTTTKSPDGTNSGVNRGAPLISSSANDNAPTNSATKPGNSAMNKSRNEFNRHRKAAITLAILVGVFILCWLPFYITSLIGAVCDDCIPELTWEITSNLLWCNSTINPFLYAAMNSHFRRNFIDLLGLRKWFPKTIDATPSSVAD